MSSRFEVDSALILLCRLRDGRDLLAGCHVVRANESSEEHYHRTGVDCLEGPAG